MMLCEELRRRLLEDRGIYVKEACDKCGQLLGAVRFTRKDDPVCGACGNAEMESVRTCQAHASTAEPNYPPASAAGLFFATMLASRQRIGSSPSCKSPGRPNYP